MSNKMSYRQYLQYHADNHGSEIKRKEAQALLNVAGDDGNLNGYFLTGNGINKKGQVVSEQQSNGFTASALNRQINPWWIDSYNKYSKQYDIDAQKGLHSNPTPSRPAGNYYNPGYNAAAAAAAEKERQQKRFYEGLLNALPGAKKLDSGRIDEKYDKSIDDLSSKRQSGLGNLDREQNKLDRQRAKSYGQIQEDTQKILQNANTMLGMYGAGNSSATQMAAIGASDAANKQSSDITDQYNDQTGDIMVARKDLEEEYKREKGSADEWKKDQYHNLDKEYRGLENDYRGRIGGEANLQRVTQAFKDMRGPDVKLKDLSSYKADGLDKVDLSGQVQAPTLEPHQAQKFFTTTTTANRKKKEDEEQSTADRLGL